MYRFLFSCIMILAVNTAAQTREWQSDDVNIWYSYQNGHVGIATTSPDELLELAKGGSLLLSAKDGQQSPGDVYFKLADGTQVGRVWTDGTSGDEKLFLASSGSNAAISIDVDGKVGMGTTTPLAGLHLTETGGARIMLSDYLGSGDANKLLGSIGARSDDPSVDVDVASIRFSTSASWGDVQNVGSSTGSAYSHPTHITFHTSDGANAETERMRISSNGSIGIGITAPGAFKLAVDGKVWSKEIVVEAEWSDFVFEDDYELQSLEAVENHIEQHGHLPDIPSASEVAANGVSVGEMHARLLQKIEELTLYTIAQQKEIGALQHENREMWRRLSEQ